MNKKVKEELQRRIYLENDDLKSLLAKCFPEKYLEFAYYVLNIEYKPDIYEGDFAEFGDRWYYDIGDNWWYDLETDIPLRKIKSDGSIYMVECQGCGRHILSDEVYVKFIDHTRTWDSLIEEFTEEYVDFRMKQDSHYFDFYFKPYPLKRIYCEDCYKLSGGK